MTLQLKAVMADAGIKQADMAEAAQISRPALSALINHGALPGRYDRAAVAARITDHLRTHGVANADRWQEDDTKQDHTEETLAPGQVVAGKRDVLVGTGTTAVRLGHVKPFGKKEMAAADWARGTSLEGVTFR